MRTKFKIQLLVVISLGGFVMTLTDKKVESDAIKSKFNDDFQYYLKKQCLKTTFNGLELETFSWYKKVLGLV